MSDRSLLEFRENPYELFDGLLLQPPSHNRAIGGWIVASHADVNAVLRRPQFGRLPGTGERSITTTPLSFLGADPPDHTRLRAIVSRPFQPSNIAALEHDVARRCHALVRAAIARRSFDLVQDIAIELATTTSCDLLGIPHDDRPQLVSWANDLTWFLEPDPPQPQQAAATAAAAHAHNYFLDAVTDPRASGIIGRLGDAIRRADCSQHEAASACILLLMAGHETTIGLIGLSVAALLDNRDQAELLASRMVEPARSVDELLRYTSPVQMLTRCANTDTNLGDANIARGEFVIAVVAAANRDPNVYEQPSKLDLTRANANRHIGFGAGTHHCLGAALARLQLQTLLSELRDHLPTVHQRADAVFTHKPLFRSIAQLPIHIAA